MMEISGQTGRGEGFRCGGAFLAPLRHGVRGWPFRDGGGQVTAWRDTKCQRLTQSGLGDSGSAPTQHGH
jgi:hypothetical protein